MRDATEPSAFRIDPVNLCLGRRNGTAIDVRLELTPRSFDVLRYLVENAGRPGDRPAALARAVRLCDLAAQTDERGWQALAWEARAWAALCCGQTAEATRHVATALAVCNGVTIPLAEWRVHATGAMAYRAVGDTALAKRHAPVPCRQLAESLPADHALRAQFERRSASLLGL